VHRVQAKSIVKINAPLELPLPFEGWYSPGLVPESTARKLLDQGSLGWQPVTVILGTGNRALRLASELLQRRVSQRVVCVESVYDRVQAWEVERRRFEVLGGRFVFGQPVSLVSKSLTAWQLKVQDPHGIRVLDTARVISVGPFGQDEGFKESPVGSFLFDWTHSDQLNFLNDVEGIMLDEHRAVVLAARLIKGLAQDSAEIKAQLEKALWISKQKLRELETIHTRRFEWKHDGKWLSNESKKVLAEFPGTPKQLIPGKWLASIECVESIGCRACERACPANAIQIDRSESAPGAPAKSFLIESDCTGCGQCLIACPSQVPVMLDGDLSQSFTQIILPYREISPLKKGDKVSLLNRKGEVLVQSKITDVFLEGLGGVTLFKVEVPTHLVWEVRGMVGVGGAPEVAHHDELYQERGVRTEVFVQGEARRVRDQQSVSVALFEIGAARPNDILICEDGSCGLCQVEIDGQKQFACETTVHQGMTIRFTRDHQPSSHLCPCEDISETEFRETCKAGHPETFEALAPLTTAGRGRCHGLICRLHCQEIARGCGVKTDGRAVDWAFPWSDWVIRD
jgi:ferredoxin